MGQARRAGGEDAGVLAAMLGRAFEDDPVAEFSFPDPDRRRRGLPRFFDIQMQREYLEGGEVYTNEERTGAALWAPPGRPAPGLRSLLALLPLLPLVGHRVVTVVRLLAAIEARHPTQPHWYLGVLGTDPEHQRRGVGSSLMAPVLERCDREGVPAYLESSKESNVAFYHRHGFEVTEEVAPVKSGPPLWLMWREPLGQP